MRGRVGVLVGAVSLLSVGVLLAQQPREQSDTKPAAAATQPGAQQAQRPAQAQHQAKARVAKAKAHKWTNEQIRAAQEGLKRAKLYNGRTNGVLSRATRRAIRAFQRKHRLTVNGELSDPLLDMLKAIPR